MSLNDLASIAIIVQGLLLLVSVGLVWYQLKENTKLIRTSNTQNLVELSAPFYLQIAQDRELASIWLQGAQRFDDLDDVDRERYFSLLTWWLMLHENIYHQWRKKLLEEDTFKSWTLDLEYFVRRQKLGRNWRQISTYFEASFADHVTEIIVRLEQEAVAS